MATAKQKAAARRNIKKAQAALRRRFGGHKRSHSSGGGSSGGSKEPGLGAAYLNAKTGIGALAPATDSVLYSVTQGGGTAALVPSLKDKANVTTLVHEAVVALDRAIDSKMGQAAAISRHSVTAIAPEVYMGLVAGSAAKGHKGLDAAREAHSHVNLVSYAYDPSNAGGVHDWSRSTFLTYRVLKHGGQLARRFATKTSIGGRLLRPVKSFLGSLGVAW